MPPSTHQVWRQEENRRPFTALNSLKLSSRPTQATRFFEQQPRRSDWRCGREPEGSAPSAHRALAGPTTGRLADVALDTLYKNRTARLQRSPHALTTRTT
jgi:hypothetical protein